MRLVCAVVYVCVTFLTCAQLEGYEGSYYLAVFNNEDEIILEENCWSGSVDEVVITSNKEKGPPSISYNSFHSEYLQIRNIVKTASSLNFEAFDPDAEEPLYRKLQLTYTEQNGQSTISLIDNSAEYTLIPITQKDQYEYVRCAEGDELDTEMLYTLSRQIFESLATANQNSFSEFTKDSGFKYMNNKQEDQLVTISQLFEKNGYSSWLRFVRERSNLFRCLDTSTPFNHCSSDMSIPTLMIKTYEQDNVVDIHVWDTKLNPYRLVIGCTVEEKWLYIKYIIVDVCAH